MLFFRCNHNVVLGVVGVSRLQLIQSTYGKSLEPCLTEKRYVLSRYLHSEPHLQNKLCMIKTIFSLLRAVTQAGC